MKDLKEFKDQGLPTYYAKYDYGVDVLPGEADASASLPYPKDDDEVHINVCSLIHQLFVELNKKGYCTIKEIVIDVDGKMEMVGVAPIFNPDVEHIDRFKAVGGGNPK